jgi:hypothetical protein
LALTLILILIVRIKENRDTHSKSPSDAKTYPSFP